MISTFITSTLLSRRLVLILVVVGSCIYISMVTNVTWSKPAWAYSLIVNNPSQILLETKSSNPTRVSASSISSGENSLIKNTLSKLKFKIKNKSSKVNFDDNSEYSRSNKNSTFSFSPRQNRKFDSDFNSVKKKSHSPSKTTLFQSSKSNKFNKQSSRKQNRGDKNQQKDDSRDSKLRADRDYLKKSRTDNKNSKSQTNSRDSNSQTLSSAYKSLLMTSPSWVQLDKNNPHLYVYSAHFDDTDSEPFVVAILTGPGKLKSFSVICVYFHLPEVFKPTAMVHGWCQDYQKPGPFIFGSYHGAYVKCPLPSAKTTNINHRDHDYNKYPYAVSVFRTNNSLPDAPKSYLHLMTNLMTINYSGRHDHGTSPAHAQTHAQPLWNITKCFPVMFRYGNTQALIEQIEVHRMFGVEHFTFYMSSAAADVHFLLKFYMEKGIAEVLNWTLPFSNFTKGGKVFFYFNQMDAIQECLLRHLRSSRYVLFGDLDEIAVPRSGNHLVPLIDRHLAKHPHCGAFLFRNSFFDPDFKGNGTRSKNNNYAGRKFAEENKLQSLLLVHRVNEVWDVPKRSKPVVIPTRVNATKVHDIESFRGNFTQCVLSPSEGLLHHYRRVPNFVGPMHKPPQAGYLFDPYLRTFSPEIVQRVGAVVRALQDISMLEDVKPEY